MLCSETSLRTFLTRPFTAYSEIVKHDII